MKKVMVFIISLVVCMTVFVGCVEPDMSTDYSWADYSWDDNTIYFEDVIYEDILYEDILYEDVIN